VNKRSAVVVWIAFLERAARAEVTVAEGEDGLLVAETARVK
jgi:hypothetical protein